MFIIHLFAHISCHVLCRKYILHMAPNRLFMALHVLNATLNAQCNLYLMKYGVLDMSKHILEVGVVLCILFAKLKTVIKQTRYASEGFIFAHPPPSLAGFCSRLPLETVPVLWTPP